MEGSVLAINTGSTSTKIGFYRSGRRVFEKNIAHEASELAKYDSVMDQDLMRLDTITEFLLSEGISLAEIDIVMGRSGLVTPMETGVYEVTEAMKTALRACANGVHACNLSGLIASELAEAVNEARRSAGNGKVCGAYIADAPMADEMWPEAKIGGLKEFPRRVLCHALNSRAMVRRYAASVGVRAEEVTAIVAHMGGGTSVTLHHGGRIVDTNDALGGDGPISAERAGTVPAFPLAEMCFSGKYTLAEIKKKLVGQGGAMSYFGTNDFRKIIAMSEEGDRQASLFIEGFCLSVAKYIAGLAATVSGKVDVIVLTGGIAYSEPLYVIALDPVKNLVIVGLREDTMMRSAICGDVNFMASDTLCGEKEYSIKIRSTSPGASGKATILPDGNLRIDFMADVNAITPGQSAVIYDGDIICASAIIDRVI